MKKLFVFATRWGPTHGGINSFNFELLAAIAQKYARAVEVTCFVAHAADDEVQSASRNSVKLIELGGDDKAPMGGSASHAAVALNLHATSSEVVWLGHDRISGAAAVDAATQTGTSSAVIHHMSYVDYESYAEGSAAAYSKKEEQRRIFQNADIVLAVGPLLRDAAADLVRNRKPVVSLTPGLADITGMFQPMSFSVFLSGRFDRGTSRIKQGLLGVAAFAEACREAQIRRAPENLCRRARLVIRGVSYDEPTLATEVQRIESEQDLATFAERRAGRVLTIHALPFELDRQRLYDDLCESSAALMPSWHEGFGLVGWEAIAAEVPLILGRNSGLYAFLDEELPGAGTGCVYAVDIDGSNSEPYFTENDVEKISRHLLVIASQPQKARRQAGILKDLLSEFTWAACAEQTIGGLGWHIEASLKSSSTATLGTSTVDEADACPMSGLFKIADNAEVLEIDSQLLRAEHSLVPFSADRIPDLEELRDWANHAEHPLSIRLVTGEGGLGKTRLGIELVRWLNTEGWVSGFVSPDLRQNDLHRGWTELIARRKPALLVIDYAEARQSEVLEIVRLFKRDAPVTPVRLLLLARSAGEWWDRLPSRDAACEAILSGHAATGPFELAPLSIDSGSRQTAYQQAIDIFASHLGIPPTNRVPSLSAEHYGRPLYIQIAALLALRGERIESAEGLTRTLLNHERRYWSRYLCSEAFPDADVYAEELLGVATLVGGFATPRQAGEYLKRCGRPISSNQLSSIFDRLVTLYPGKQGLDAVRPDLLGEALVKRRLLRESAFQLLAAVLGPQATTQARRSTLAILSRMALVSSPYESVVEDALAVNLRYCLAEAIEASVQSDGDLPALIERAFRKMGAREASQIAGLLKPHLNYASVRLAALRVALAEFELEKTRGKHSRDSNRDEAIRVHADALSHLGDVLDDAGRTEDGVPYTLAACQLLEPLFRRNQHRYANDYSSKLLTHSVLLTRARNVGDALVACEEVIKIRAGWASKGPVPAADYALALLNFGNTLTVSGRIEEAVQQTKNGMELLKSVCPPINPRTTLISATLNTAIQLTNINDYEAGLALADEATRLLAPLAATNADRFEPDYTLALWVQADCLAEVGRLEEAIKIADDAAGIRRRLVAKDPQRFSSELANFLSNEATLYSRMGQYERALKPTQEAFEIYQRLELRSSTRFSSEVAMAYHNLGSHLADCGRLSEGLSLQEEAMRRYIDLHSHEPRMFARALAGSINGVAFSRWLLGNDTDPQEALVRELLSDIDAPHRTSVEVQLCALKGLVENDVPIRHKAFQDFIERWPTLSKSARRILEWELFPVVAWLNCNGLPVDDAIDWRGDWARYSARVNGSYPRWIPSMESRLGVQFASLSR
jgi:tetratricopeptide (TPR) repeat protein